MFNIGGITEKKDPDEKVVNIANNVRASLTSIIDIEVTDFLVDSYKTQLVNGVNYFIKIHIGNNIYVHVRVYRSFDKEESLVSFKYPKKKEDEIEYF